MLIGLDFDLTYTADPIMWNSFIRMAQARGHTVAIVTMRCKDDTHPYLDGLSGDGIPIYYVSLGPIQPRTKVAAMAEVGLVVDIWVDDKPQYIYGTRGDWDMSAYRDWRASDLAHQRTLPPYTKLAA